MVHKDVYFIIPLSLSNPLGKNFFKLTKFFWGVGGDLSSHEMKEHPSLQFIPENVCFPFI